MDPPTVLERFSDAAKVVLLDYAAQPKLWELWYRYVQQWRHQGEKDYQEIPLLCFHGRDTVESPKTCIFASLRSQCREMSSSKPGIFLEERSRNDMVFD
jgi:hypothetical protein